MEGKTIVLDNPEGAEKFNAVFSVRGNVVVSPTELYDRLEVPEEYRAKFTIRPYNAVLAEEIKNINKEAIAEAYKRFRDLGINHLEHSQRLNDLEEMIKSGDFDEKEKLELRKELVTVEHTWLECFEYGQRHRNLARVIELMVDNVASVKNLVYKEGETYHSYSGSINYELMGYLNPNIIKWLDEEMQRISGLSENEIMGF